MLLFIFSTFFMRLTFKRTVKDLLMMFRQARAFSPETARFVDELGIKERSLLNFRVMRDYTPQVLDALIKENIVQTTEEGKIYLSEKTLAEHHLSALDKGQSTPAE